MKDLHIETVEHTRQSKRVFASHLAEWHWEVIFIVLRPQYITMKLDTKAACVAAERPLCKDDIIIVPDETTCAGTFV